MNTATHDVAAAGLVKPPSVTATARRGQQEHSDWRVLLHSCRAARDAAYLGPIQAARAAVEAVREADRSLRVLMKAVLASQAAKNEFYTDQGAIDRFLREHDEFLAEMAKHRPRPPRQLRAERRLPLPVDAARAVPIVQLLRRHGVELRRRGARLVGLCPFHDDTRPSLQVNERAGVWHCFPCGAGGDGIGFVMRLKRINFATAVQEVVG